MSSIATSGSKIEKRSTGIQHVYLIDWNDDGILREIAVVKESEDGTIHGIEVDKLHPIDAKRLKNIVTSIHADKYPLWELLSNARISNGINPLDFFHSNYVRVKRPRGAIMGGTYSALSLSTSIQGADNFIDNGQMIGSGFSSGPAMVAAPGEFKG